MSEEIIARLKEDLRSSDEALKGMSKQFVKTTAELKAVQEAAGKAVKSASQMVDELDKLLSEVCNDIEQEIWNAAKEYNWPTTVVESVLDSLPSTVVTLEKLEEVKKRYAVK